MLIFFSLFNDFHSCKPKLDSYYIEKIAHLINKVHEYQQVCALNYIITLYGFEPADPIMWSPNSLLIIHKMFKTQISSFYLTQSYPTKKTQSVVMFIWVHDKIVTLTSKIIERIL